MTSSNNLLYDAFISYSSNDREWVRTVLLPFLEPKGIRTCIDYRDFDAGLPIVHTIGDSIQNSWKVLLILTPSYLQKDWTIFEALLLQTKDPLNKNLKFIPIKKEPCELPSELGIYGYIDFTDPSIDQEQWDRLARVFGQDPTNPKAPPFGLPCSGVKVFVGRDEMMAQVHTGLQQQGSLIITAIQGMGGGW